MSDLPFETPRRLGVYSAIARVQSAMAATGIRKGRKNEQQHYQFRGIDEVLNALSSVLADNGLCILPRMLNRTADQRESKSGGVLNYVVVEAEFDIVAAIDGSQHTVRTCGEAMDSADKATNKAMSAAYKYMAILTFCIPTEGDNDADATTHELVAALPPAKQALAIAAAAQGMDAYAAFWRALTPAEQRLHLPKHEALKAAAQSVDKSRADHAAAQVENNAAT